MGKSSKSSHLERIRSLEVGFVRLEKLVSRWIFVLWLVIVCWIGVLASMFLFK